MEVLKKLFEHHFHAPPEHIVPLQGELGGSGRKIIRLSNEKRRAIGKMSSIDLRVYQKADQIICGLAAFFRGHLAPILKRLCKRAVIVLNVSAGKVKICSRIFCFAKSHD